jgi:hypothetical protein
MKMLPSKIFVVRKSSNKYHAREEERIAGCAWKFCGGKHYSFLIFFGYFLASRQESDKKPGEWTVAKALTDA